MRPLIDRRQLLRLPIDTNRHNTEVLHKSREEDEQLLSRECLAETHTTPDAERHQVFCARQLQLLCLRVHVRKVGLGVEVVSVRPNFRVVMDCISLLIKQT